MNLLVNCPWLPTCCMMSDPRSSPRGEMLPPENEFPEGVFTWCSVVQSSILPTMSVVETPSVRGMDLYFPIA